MIETNLPLTLRKFVIAVSKSPSALISELNAFVAKVLTSAISPTK